MLLVLYTTLLIFFFIHITDVFKVLKTVYTVITPIIYGLIIAYLLNFPYKLFHNHAFRKMGTKHKWLEKLRKPLSLLLAYVLIFGIVGFLISVLIPELINTIQKLIQKIPVYQETIIKSADSIVVFVERHTGYYLYEYATYNNIITLITGDNTTVFLNKVSTEILPSAFSTVLGIGTSLYNWILGIIISIYLLAGKERLLRQFKLLLLAYTPKRVSRRLFKIGEVFNNKCGKFIVGKIIDSAIIGVMCYIGCLIFRFDFPLLISFIIGICNIVPFFGPIIGAIPTTLLLLVNSPMEALGFLIFVIVLQQFDGNILGPKILGETVGISGFWIIVSVIVGGGLFGVPGMILGVPIFAALYTLIEEGAERRLKKKQITVTATVNTDEEVPAEKSNDPSVVDKLHDLLNKGKNK